VLVIEFTQLGTSAHVSLCVPNPVGISRPTSAGRGRWISKGRPHWPAYASAYWDLADLCLQRGLNVVTEHA
jgi:hypothetical protein